MDKDKQREWITPLTIGTFLVSAVTGMLLFFHLNLGWIKIVHEWFSWLLIFGGIGHVFINWKSFVRYISNPLGQVIVSMCLILILVSFLPHGGGKTRHPFMQISDTLVEMPLTNIAQIMKKNPDELMNKLRVRNIVVGNRVQTVKEIARSNNKKDFEVLMLIFNVCENDKNHS